MEEKREGNGTIPAHLRLGTLHHERCTETVRNKMQLSFQSHANTHFNYFFQLHFPTKDQAAESPVITPYCNHPTYTEFAQARMKRKKTFARIQSKAVTWYSTWLHQKTFEKSQNPGEKWLFPYIRLKPITYRYAVFSH